MVTIAALPASASLAASHSGSRRCSAARSSATPANVFGEAIWLSLVTATVGAVLNPLRSEQEAFRFLVYVAIVFGVIIAVVLIARAL